MPNRPPTFRIGPAQPAQRRRGKQDTRRLYNLQRWKRESKLFLALHPLCECSACTQSARPLPSQVVDHHPPHRGDLAAFFDVGRWRALARRCHDRITARYDGGLGNPKRQRPGT